MRVLISALAVLSSLGLDPCSGGGGDGGGTNTPPAEQTTTGGDEPGGAQNGGGGVPPLPAAGVTIPEIFYGGWDYQTATLYQKGEEPIVSSVGGSADFRKDLTYEQSYSIGGIGNFYSGRYTVDGPDPRVKGTFLITTYDEDDNEAFKFSVACGDTKGMALTIYDDAGEPSIVYGLKARED